MRYRYRVTHILIASHLALVFFFAFTAYYWYLPHKNYTVVLGFEW